uniref:Uncharacterized protein n=1 Tax=Solanum tuberosum TaxID=4113 RepID=M0ZZ41_SOLTU
MVYSIDAHNRIQSHENRLRNWNVPTGEENWRTFLTSLTGDSIRWKYPWMAGLAFVKTRHLYFIKLIGLGGIQPYDRVRRHLTICASLSFATIWSCPIHTAMVDHGITWRWFYLNPSSAGKEQGTCNQNGIT